MKIAELFEGQATNLEIIRFQAKQHRIKVSDIENQYIGKHRSVRVRLEITTRGRMDLSRLIDDDDAESTLKKRLEKTDPFIAARNQIADFIDAVVVDCLDVEGLEFRWGPLYDHRPSTIIPVNEWRRELPGEIEAAYHKFMELDLDITFLFPDEDYYP